jgi:hypothetical protein
MTIRPFPKGEKYPGFFSRPERPAWLARNLRAWEHLRNLPPVNTTVSEVRVRPLRHSGPRC